MMTALLTRAMRRGAQTHIRYVRPVPAESAPEPVAGIYAQVERDFGVLAPPISLHASAPVTLAAAWSLLRETLVATGRTGRTAKEVVATVVSLENACPYCVDVHGTALHGLIKDTVARAIAESRMESIVDPEIRRTALWARASMRPESAERIRPQTVPDEQFPELAGIVLTFNYLNRMVNVFLEPAPLPRGVPSVVRGGLQGLMGRIMRPWLLGDRKPGASLAMLPAASLPDDLFWATGYPSVAIALARAVAAIEKAGERAAPEAVRRLMLSRLADWTGRPPGPSRAWVEEPVAELPPGERSSGRLALLTAMASYQIDRSLIEDVRREGADDQSLIELTSWASLAAARRVIRWLPAPAVQARLVSNERTNT